MAQRLVRAKARSATHGSLTRFPAKPNLPDRLRAVRRGYLIFNEGHTATSGDALIARI